MGRRFLFINQFYPPDVAPTGRILHDVATTLVHRGHSVQVVCSRRAYATGEDLGRGEQLDGVEVRRLSSFGGRHRSMGIRVADDAAFLFQAAVRVMTAAPRPDVVLAASSPPFLGVPVGLTARRTGVAYVHWAMDLYPDVLEAHGRLPQLPVARWVLSRLARIQLGSADLVLTLGRHMAERVARRFANPPLTRVVPLWSEVETRAEMDGAAAAVRAKRNWPLGELVLLYSGNMGRGHRFQEFLESAARLGGGGPLWAFVGGGPRRAEVETFVREHPAARVQLLPYVPPADVDASHRSADVHLVSLSSSWQGSIVPSKLQAAFGAGRPVIFVGGPENEIAGWIRDSGGGWVVAERDVEGLLAAVKAAGDSAERQRRGQAALAYAREHFDREWNSSRVADLFEDCGGSAR